MVTLLEASVVDPLWIVWLYPSCVRIGRDVVAMATALQKIDMDLEQQLYTPKIENIVTAVIEMHGDIEALHWTRQQQYPR
ncbi:hypothetical protein LAZ67_14003415 [Cordylochernes scorpioides]|uniref:Uncharacterized protein n=1 Tax=Cordylochernes scorpioides TaxID=51811 RepID=A0ABY6L7L1_9ARAC|nr:hypothetical protein LAZ67_14003415 [Cordylochernes scorpioides]